MAESGFTVILVDLSQDALQRAEEAVGNSLRLRRLLGRGPESESPEEVLSRIHSSTVLCELKDADFVVENITETWQAKAEAFRQMDTLCPESTILASNTSAIPITRIAGATNRPEKVLGLHFMNPVPLKTTVEVIKGVHTSDDTVEVSMEMLSRMGKEGILVNDSPGFVSNRVLMLTVNEAAYLIYEQVAAPESVDRIFKSCFEHKMGPLETADLIGLDTVLLSIEVLYGDFKDPKFRPCPLLQRMVDAGLLGRKSGEGFYKYES
jgi:3-hydroxybutyryl-CoA dehydrogenase